MADTPRLEEAVEFAENPEPRCPCVLLLDTSGSMQGNAVAALNEGLRAFKEDLIKDPLASRRVEVAVAAPIPTRLRKVRARVAVVFALVMLWPSVASPIGKSPSGTSPQGSVQAPAKKPPAPATTSPGQIQGRNGTEMVLVPAGEFWMGSPAGEGDNGEHPQHRILPVRWPKQGRAGWGDNNEHPQHRVYLDAFYIDKFEVSNARYRKCVEAGKCTPPHDLEWYKDPQRADHPVVNVDWEQAQTYCGWAGRRLPTEAEWEKAARGTDGRVYPWGNDFDSDHANIGGNQDGYGDTAPGGSFPSGASPYGALDMAGNVWEWVADWYGENYYASSSSRNPKGPESGEYRVLRGGSWADGQVSTRAACRGGFVPDYWGGHHGGCRCAQDFR